MRRSKILLVGIPKWTNKEWKGESYHRKKYKNIYPRRKIQESKFEKVHPYWVPKQKNSVHHCDISEQQGKDKVLKASRSCTEMTKTQNGIRLQYHWLEDNSSYHLFSGKIILNLELYIQPHYQSSEGSYHLLGIYYASGTALNDLHAPTHLIFIALPKYRYYYHFPILQMGNWCTYC